MLRGLNLVIAGMIVALAGAAQAEPRDIARGTDLPVIGKMAVIAPAPDTDQNTEAAPDDDSDQEIDWSRVDIDAIALMRAASKRSAHDFTLDSQGRAVWSRTENRNGSSNMTVKRSLSTGLTTHVGIDMVVAPQIPSSLPGAAIQSSTGALWASTIVPAIGPMGWDLATIDARLNPNDDQGRLAARFSKSISLSDTFSMTIQNGYGVNRTFGGSGQWADAEQLAKLNLLPTGTSLFAGTKLSTADDRWLNSVGAEQKIFGGISLTGTVSETTSGEADRSLTAAFKRAW